MRFAYPLSLLAVLAACTSSHVPVDPDAPACVASFATCERDSDCCAGNYCDGPYGPSVCTPTSPDGMFCVSSRECASGTCVENVCGGTVPVCSPAGSACSLAGGLPCCEGTRCREAPGSFACLPPSADGEACAEAADCASGVCTSGVCGIPPPTCSARGSSCLGALDCCEGTTCVMYGGSPDSYVVAFCAAIVADGGSCAEADTVCASGSCAEGLCRASACRPLDAVCETGTHAECCTGFCDFGFSYGVGVCRARLPAGQPCYDDGWCQSGHCSPERSCL
jgi:hypothetical protein